jgi:hypothetical protein
MAGDQSYQKGNTRELAAEWDFHFVLSHPDHDKISEVQVEAFWTKVLDAVDDAGLQLGGSFKPISDEDYERMARGED